MRVLLSMSFLTRFFSISGKWMVDGKHRLKQIALVIEIINISKHLPWFIVNWAISHAIYALMQISVRCLHWWHNYLDIFVTYIGNSRKRRNIPEIQYQNTRNIMQIAHTPISLFKSFAKKITFKAYFLSINTVPKSILLSSL